MTRASFANPGEKTFQKRCRSFCESCWTSGNRHQEQKLTDDCDCHKNSNTSKAKGTQLEADETKTCECTNKNDGWVCLECKHLQNKVWLTNLCFGEGCSNPLDSAAERRKICMWCDKPLPITATREKPHVYKQKVVDAMAQEAASRQADLEAHALRRRKRLRMTLRELRGDEAVSRNPLANEPNLVRHLDTVNYTRVLGYDHSPTSSQVYNSKLGNWQYSRSFLLSFRSRCDSIGVSLHVKDATRSDKPTTPERTNRELFAQVAEERRAARRRHQAQRLSSATWEAHRGEILRMRYLERRSVKDIQDTLFKEHGLWESEDNYCRTLAMWQENAADDMVRSSGARAADPAQISSLDSDIPNYWQDVGPAVMNTDGNVHSFLGRRKYESGGSDDHASVSASSPGSLPAPSSAAALDPAAREEENEEDEMNLQTAIHESLTEREAVEHQPDIDRGGILNDHEDESLDEQGNEDEQQHDTEQPNDDALAGENAQADENEDEHVDAHSYENWNVSRADGRPPVYFA